MNRKSSNLVPGVLNYTPFARASSSSDNFLPVHFYVNVDTLLDVAHKIRGMNNITQKCKRNS